MVGIKTNIRKEGSWKRSSLFKNKNILFFILRLEHYESKYKKFMHIGQILLLQIIFLIVKNIVVILFVTNVAL